MDSVHKWANELKIRKLENVLKDRGFGVVCVESVEDVKKSVMDMIPVGSVIAVGGSVTLNETGIIEEIKKPEYKFIDRFNTKSFDEELDKYREGYFADVFLSSTNAVTMEGQLVNIDCTGNRTGQIAFGPKKVIIVAGVNKIVDTIEDGLKRAKSIAPMNARRLGHKTPCATDDCMDCCNCDAQMRVCNIISIIDGCYKFPGRITVVLVPEELGY